MSGKYIYESHLGGLYAVEHPIPDEHLYCETCGDYDDLVGYAESKSKARKLLKHYDFDPKYLREFLKNNFEEG